MRIGEVLSSGLDLDVPDCLAIKKGEMFLPHDVLATVAKYTGWAKSLNRWPLYNMRAGPFNDVPNYAPTFLESR